MHIVQANWSAPSNIQAITTTRQNGRSTDAYATNNLGLHVGDNKATVEQNRQNVINSLQLPNDPFWLNQTHSTNCVIVTDNNCENSADAAITKNKNIPLVVMTADCLPIVLCDKNGTEIAAIHAGWKGLVNGIIENTIQKLSQHPNNYIAWIGPAICGNCYTTDKDVFDKFIYHYPWCYDSFTKNNSRFHTNLAKIAKMLLNRLGVDKVFLSNLCTYEENDKFYSYRKQEKTGRIATLIWFSGKI